MNDEAPPEQPASPDTGHRVLLALVGVIVAHTAFRAWAIAGSWFHEDDFEFLHYARTHDFTLEYLMTPHGGHLMPFGRVLIELSLQSGAFNWPATAIPTMVMQLGVAVSAAWMLVKLFGMRWGILPPLLVFLSSAATMPASVWWSAAMNQQGQLIGLMCGVGCWVTYGRTRSWRWLVLTLLSIALALVCDIRGVLIPPLLGALSLGWFASGSLRQRMKDVLRRNWLAVLLVALLAGSVVLFYVTHVSGATSAPEWSLLGPLAAQMLGETLATSLVGGPWHWVTWAPPAAFAGPPATLVHLSWVVLATVIAYGFLTRVRTMRAWLLLLGYSCMLLVLLWTSRAPYIGPAAGTEYRYLTDAPAVAALALGLAYLPLRGAVGSSEPRPESLLRVTIPFRCVWVAIGCTTALGTYSAVQYAQVWNGNTVPRNYVQTLKNEFQRVGDVSVAAGPIPESVLATLIWPTDPLPRLAGLLSSSVRFPTVTERLAVVTDQGFLTHAEIDAISSSRPTSAKNRDCGWRIEGGARRIPLTSPVFAMPTWIRINYVAPREAPVTILAGKTRIESTLRAGPNQLFARVEGSEFDSVHLGGLNESMTICVDRITVGDAVPGPPLR